MINVVYLVLVMSGGSSGVTSERIPQANIQQCEVNKKHTLPRQTVIDAFCVVGVE